MCNKKMGKDVMPLSKKAMKANLKLMEVKNDALQQKISKGVNMNGKRLYLFLSFSYLCFSLLTRDCIF